MGMISEIPSSKPNVFAFRLSGELSKDDLVSMAETMLNAFEQHPSINMLLVFDDYEGTQIAAGMHGSVLKAQLKGVSKVDKYAVVGAPGVAEKIVELSDVIMPVASASFSADELGKAWAFVGADPAAPVT